MKKIIIAIVMITFAFILNAKNQKELFQVITSDPHIVEKMKFFLKTQKLDGRLWIVEANEKFPTKFKKYLKPITGKEKTYLANDIQKINANPEINQMLQGLSSGNIKTSVEYLSSFKTRAAGTLENQKAIDWIYQKFTDLGFKVSKECYRLQACSVIAEKESDKTEETILIEAHMDSVGKNFAGADDNASGTSIVLEIARVLSQYNNNKNLRFFITNGEELGLLGAKHYVNQLESRGELQKLILVINMDMAGYNSNNIIELETNDEFENLAKWFAELSKTYTTLIPKITLGAWGSDHVPFLEKGISTLLTIEDWSTKTPCYHQECDKPDTLNYAYATEIARLNVAAVMTKDLE